jgi:hypothetical protein
VAYSDPATGNQLAYLEALHRQLRGEVTPSFTDGLNRKQASVMIDEAKGLLLQKEHARLMALGLPIPEPAPAPPQNVTAIPTDAREEWAARKRDELAAQQRERRARSDTATAHLRDRYIAQFGGPNRYAPPQHMADDHRAFIVLWKATSATPGTNTLASGDGSASTRATATTCRIEAAPPSTAGVAACRTRSTITRSTTATRRQSSLPIYECTTCGSNPVSSPGAECSSCQAKKVK